MRGWMSAAISKEEDEFFVDYVNGVVEKQLSLNNNIE